VIIVATDRAKARAELNADYTPQFVQVARTVRDRITDGTYPKFGLVPGSRSLAAEFGVSQVVALHGLTVLVRAGYLRHFESKPHQVIWDGCEDAARDEEPALCAWGSP
jgi:DNA-binding transcriptional regulator YhcF (GntR family)